MDGHVTDAEGKPILTRTRYYDIKADAFHMQQDRSIDNGQTGKKASLTIDAKRVAAHRGALIVQNVILRSSTGYRMSRAWVWLQLAVAWLPIWALFAR